MTVSSLPARSVGEQIDALDLPPVVRAWIGQLLSMEVRQLLDADPDRQVEVRLFGRDGKARKRPVILLNAGPTERY